MIWQAHWKRVSLKAGPRASAGLATAYGNAKGNVDSHAVREPYVDSALETEGKWRFVDYAAVIFGLDMGIAKGLFATTDGQTSLAMGGFFVGGRLGIEILP
jgi:hypothetical protein